ncbi:MAG: hypothetical protein Kow0069_37170 [Promethearchaeota archaeon]
MNTKRVGSANGFNAGMRTFLSSVERLRVVLAECDGAAEREAQATLELAAFAYALAEGGFVRKLGRHERGANSSQCRGESLFKALASTGDFPGELDRLAREALQASDVAPWEVGGQRFLVPALGPGLFSPGMRRTGSSFEWERLVSTFSRFKWTLREESGTSDEMFVTPRLLARFHERFEDQLIADPNHGNARRKFGAVYTPAPVAKYVCERVLVPYVLDDDFATFDDAVALASDTDEDGKRSARQRLLQVRVVDPACGAGEFLVAAARLLEDLASAFLERGQRLRQFPRRILEHNLRGVDLREEATRAARRRLAAWYLARVGPEEALGLRGRPSRVDFTRVVRRGNSLVGWPFGVVNVAGRDATTNPRTVWSDLSFADLAGVTVDELRALDPLHWPVEFPEVRAEGGFHAVVGNPPYLRVQKKGKGKHHDDAVATRDAIERKVFSATFETFAHEVDAFVLFVERCTFGLLGREGRLGLVVPNRFLTVKYGAQLRRMLEHRAYRVVDFGANQVFGERSVTNYVALLFCRSQPSRRGGRYEFFKFRRNFSSLFGTRALPRFPGGEGARATREAGEEDAPDAFAKSWRGKPSLDVGWFDDDPWVLLKAVEERNLLPTFAAARPLSSLVGRVHEGFSTGLKGFFVLHDAQAGERVVDGRRVEVVTAYSRVHGGEVTLERVLCKPYSDQVSRDGRLVDEGKVVVFPYELRDGSARLVDLDDYPLANRYFLAHEGALRRRAGFKSKEDGWHAYSALRNAGTYEREKVVFKFMAGRIPRVALDDQGFYHDNTVNNVVVDDGGVLPAGVLVALLRSKFVQYFVARFGVLMASGWTRYEDRFLSHLPVPADPPPPELVDDNGLSEQEREEAIYDWYGFDEDFRQFVDQYLNSWIKKDSAPAAGRAKKRRPR